jgi:hypothetical protein
VAKSASKKKQTPKTKRGESRTSLCMTDLYIKENPFISTIVEPNVEVFKKDSLVGDDESIINSPSTKVEKGNSSKTLISAVHESSRKLGLEDLNEAIDFLVLLRRIQQKILLNLLLTSVMVLRMVNTMLEHLWTNKKKNLMILDLLIKNLLIRLKRMNKVIQKQMKWRLILRRILLVKKVKKM